MRWEQIAIFFLLGLLAGGAAVFAYVMWLLRHPRNRKVEEVIPEYGRDRGRVTVVPPRKPLNREVLASGGGSSDPPPHLHVVEE